MTYSGIFGYHQYFTNNFTSLESSCFQASCLSGSLSIHSCLHIIPFFNSFIGEFERYSPAFGEGALISIFWRVGVIHVQCIYYLVPYTDHQSSTTPFWGGGGGGAPTFIYGGWGALTSIVFTIWHHMVIRKHRAFWHLMSLLLPWGNLIIAQVKKDMNKIRTKHNEVWNIIIILVVYWLVPC